MLSQGLRIFLSNCKRNFNNSHTPPRLYTNENEGAVYKDVMNTVRESKIVTRIIYKAERR